MNSNIIIDVFIIAKTRGQLIATVAPVASITTTRSRIADVRIVGVDLQQDDEHSIQNEQKDRARQIQTDPVVAHPEEKQNGRDNAETDQFEVVLRNHHQGKSTVGYHTV